MKPKTLMMLVVAGGCGLVALLGFQSMQGSAKAKVETARVLVVIDTIDSGEVLSEENVKFKDIPVESILIKDPVLQAEQFKDRSALLPLSAGDIVAVSKLSEPGVSGASTQIPKGMRVHTISVTDSHTHSAMLRAGDRVDVLVTYKSKSAKGGTVTRNKTLLEYIEVFATGNQTATKAADAEGAKVKNVSLLVTPEQVSFVILAASKGELSLSWRNKSDDQLVQVGEVDEKLLEELEGTVGMFEDRPLYDVVGTDAEPVEEMVPDNEAPPTPASNTATAPQPNSPASFLDTAAPAARLPAARPPAARGPAAAPQFAATPVAVLPAAGTSDQPTWTMHVYQKGQPQVQQFAVPAAEQNWLSSGLKTMFGAGSTTDSAPAPQQAP